MREAAREIAGKVEGTLLVSDAGSENVNRNVDDVLDGIELERVLAQIDVTYSNSMLEAFWRSLKHSWLYLHGLETESEVQRLVAFYVEAHNDVMPHSAFDGQTPNEVFFGTGIRSSPNSRRSGYRLRPSEWLGIDRRDAGYASGGQGE